VGSSNGAWESATDESLRTMDDMSLGGQKKLRNSDYRQKHEGEQENQKRRRNAKKLKHGPNEPKSHGFVKKPRGKLERQQSEQTLNGATERQQRPVIGKRRRSWRGRESRQGERKH
jgi:hypothetical protein